MSDTRSGRAYSVILLLFVGFGVAALAVSPLDQARGPLLVFALALSFVAMEMAPLPLPRGEQYRLDAGVAVAAMLLLNPVSAGLTALVGSALGVSLVCVGSVKRRDVADVVRTGATVCLAATVWEYAGLSASVDPTSLASWANAFGLGLLYMMIDLVGWTVVRTRTSGSGMPRSLGNLFGLLGSLYLGHISAGVAVAVVENSLGPLAIVSLVLLMLIMQHTFGLLLRVRAAYTMTVSALSKVAEMSQGMQPGHGERVADMSASVGRFLGLSASVIERLTLAALLHDIGGVREEPISHRAHRAHEKHQASAGATLMSRVNFLSSLAPVIARHANPYCDFIDTNDTDGLLARIIHVVSDFDRIISESAGRAESVLQMMAQGKGTEYDPRVLDALEAIVRGGRIP